MKNLENLSKYNRALVVGTGGGNDIVSATLISDYLSKQGIICDVAGILSPGAIHEFGSEYEKPVNLIEGEIKRYINSKEKREISFIDSDLPELAKSLEYPVNRFYEFSTKYGTKELLDSVNNLIEENNYDLFLGVDVGGDILSEFNKDKNILSPLMDFTTLHLLGKVNVDSYLVQFGLGTDGELRKERIGEILSELNQKNLILGEASIGNEDSEIARFRELFSDISIAPQKPKQRKPLSGKMKANVGFLEACNLAYFSS